MFNTYSSAKFHGPAVFQSPGLPMWQGLLLETWRGDGPVVYADFTQACGEVMIPVMIRANPQTRYCEHICWSTWNHYTRNMDCVVFVEDAARKCFYAASWMGLNTKDANVFRRIATEFGSIWKCGYNRIHKKKKKTLVFKCSPSFKLTHILFNTRWRFPKMWLAQIHAWFHVVSLLVP